MPGHRDNPKDWPVVTDTSTGTRYLRLPNGIIRAYEEDELAQLCVDAIAHARDNPAQANEKWLAALRHMAGEEEWKLALVITNAAGEIAEALGIQDDTRP
jgi:hypothetical protein